jgi:integrase
MNLTKKKGVYYASFQTAGGKTKTISTRCTDEREAKKVVQESGLKDLELAARAGKLTNEAIGHITTGRKITVEKSLPAFEEWLGAIAKSPKTIYNTTSTVRKWADEAKIAHLPPAAITEKHIANWVNDPEADASVGTRKVNLAAIRNYFRFLCGKGWCSGNPSELVGVTMEGLSHEQKEKQEREPLAAEEIKHTLAELAKRPQNPGIIFWTFAVRAADELGLRLGDICQLEWECFNTEGRLVIWTDKRNKRLDEPISKSLSHLTTEIPVEHAKYVFPRQREIIRDPVKRASLSVWFTRFLRSIGIEGKSFHCIRHAVATREFNKADKEALAKKLAEALTLDQIANLLGHSDRKTTKGYVHK